MKRIVTAALFLLSVMSVATIHAQDKAKTAKTADTAADDSSAKALVYIARNAPSTALKEAVAEFLQDTDSRVVSDAISNILLVQTTAENQKRVLALLQQLDRPPKTFRVQMHLFLARGEALDELDTAALSGQTDEVLKRIKALEATQRVHVAKQIELTALENNPTFLQVGEDVRLLTARTVAPGRGAANSYSSVSVGTILKVEARWSGESDIVLEIDFESSDIDPPSAPADEEARPVPPGVSRLTLQTTARIRDGNSLLVGTLIDRSTEGDREAYLVLSASIETSPHPQRIAKLKSSSPQPAPKAGSKGARPAAGSKTIDPRYAAYFVKLIEKYDQNRDKALDAEERSKMSKDCSAADTDKDGLVSVEELMTWSLKLQAKRPN